MTRRAISAFAVFFAVCPGFAATAERPPTYCLIVSDSSPIRNLSFAEARLIFLGVRTRWPGGRQIAVVIPPEGSAARQFLLSKIVDLSDIDFSQRWVGQVYRGAVARAPSTARNPEDLRKLIAASDVAIGIADCHDLGPGVRALAINEKRPGEPGYGLE